MTNSNKTLIAALLDRTGSMSSSKAATEDGFNEMLRDQKNQPGHCLVTLAQFDRPGGFMGGVRINADITRWEEEPILEWIYTNKPVADVPDLVLQPRGSTPLYDAVHQFVDQVGRDLKRLSEADRPGMVICVIMTDGGENASHQYTAEHVKKLISQQQDVYNWKFIFIGANINAQEVGRTMGIPQAAAATFDSHDYISNRVAYSAVSSNVSNLRSGVVMDASFTAAERGAMMGEAVPDEIKDRVVKDKKTKASSGS